MKIAQFRQLIEIVQEGSINRAAINMYMARSSLSTSMKNLEEELGEKIFDRTHKGVALTEFGRAVYLHARDIVDRVDFLQDINAGTQGFKLSVASMYSTLANHALLKFFEKHPGESLSGNIEEMNMTELISKVRSGLAEIGIVTLFSDKKSLTLQKFRGSELEYHKLFDRELYAIVGPKNPLYQLKEEKVSVKQLQDFIYIANHNSPADSSVQSAIAQDKEDHVVFGVSDLGLALKLVEQSHAVLIDTYEAQAFSIFYSPNKLRFLPIKDMPINCQLGYVKRKDHQLSEVAKEFLNVLNQCIKEI